MKKETSKPNLCSRSLGWKTSSIIWCLFLCCVLPLFELLLPSNFFDQMFLKLLDFFPEFINSYSFINTPASGLLTNREQRMKNPEEIHVFGKRGGASGTRNPEQIYQINQS
ncbi:hypothetical protein GOODEAATRI_033856 [Goodea atripinnis]|uniref:Uncharacterized protein n=1 Tax=Goodea atripinnis TaxID=208336 RepID=A0ABV0MXB7_9TELE